MTYIRTNVPGWVKDSRTGAVINTQTSQLDQLKAARIKNREFKALENEVKTLRAIVNRLCRELNITDV
jgi:hypothetical protein